ncbi:LON peptidase substrate-binding domain-containing protein [Blastopirellula sp. JC732]|uniref:LON peptidase substrate-binding domain-containing protein n=1 Tax=Blastopirellula sediminis TaxID=2894196 RepID=A0A9X1SFZ9_9BACT|nr:LON peptidase substrate-binding domain-containing protein [Blastopirellula sediminis]MCC9608846.1 LON peptidase substrate-binding domain-containing protein [Blastopirellula sediminis]MCC9628377.1 LON peptidase substrate-binding domain-containing protein [Blastopirellula sediminis]
MSSASAYPIRLFPLPNLVLFPGVLQPLYIFEPRYRELLERAKGDDGRIAMALLKPGWQQQYEESPALYDIVCIGEIVACQTHDDGTSNILLRGSKRAKILHEIDSPGAYRMAVVEDLPGAATNGTNAAGEVALRLKRTLAKTEFAQMFEQPSLGANPSLDVLSDAVAYALPWPLLMKQQLLAETNAIRRGEQLISWLSQSAADPQSLGRPTFPLRASAN